MSDDEQRAPQVHREDAWSSLNFHQFQRIGVSTSHSGHATVEWVPLIQKPIDGVLWFACNWHKLLWRSQLAAFRWLRKPTSGIQALLAGVNLAAWFAGLSWLSLAVARHVG